MVGECPKSGGTVYSPEAMQTVIFGGLGLAKKVTGWSLNVGSQVWTEAGGFKKSENKQSWLTAVSSKDL